VTCNPSPDYISRRVHSLDHHRNWYSARLAHRKDVLRTLSGNRYEAKRDEDQAACCENDGCEGWVRSCRSVSDDLAVILSVERKSAGLR
jgi:hypothetical protein